MTARADREMLDLLGGGNQGPVPGGMSAPVRPGRRLGCLGDVSKAAHEATSLTVTAARRGPKGPALGEDGDTVSLLRGEAVLAHQQHPLAVGDHHGQGVRSTAPGWSRELQARRRRPAAARWKRRAVGVSRHPVGPAVQALDNDVVTVSR
jgi:hypothetical protein